MSIPSDRPTAELTALARWRRLAAVHAAGHIHPDVKPSNAVVSGVGSEERVIPIDFGRSRLRRADRPAKAVGGTRAYMAPKQLHTWKAGARSDMFSAALVLVKLVTGWPRANDENDPASLDEIADAALRCALERGLAKDPLERPSASDFAQALRGEAPDEPPDPGEPQPIPDSSFVPARMHEVASTADIFR